MANELDRGYFGVRLGDALSQGAGHIAGALENRYAMQNKRKLIEEERARTAPLDALKIQEIMAGLEAHKADLEKTRAETDLYKKRAGEISPDMGEAALEIQGIPKRKDPYANLDKTVRNRVQAANMINAGKKLAEYQKVSDDLKAETGDLLRVKKLLDEGMKTGPIVGRTYPIRQLFSEDAGKAYQSFETVANKLIPKMRQGMPGAASDRDVAMFAKATIGIKKEEPVNMEIIDQALAVNKRIDDKASFMSEYVNTYGDLQGSDAAWNKYINAVPLFSEDGRVNPYVSAKEYFSTESTNNIPSQPSAPKPAEWNTEKENRLQELRSKLGRK